MNIEAKVYRLNSQNADIRKILEYNFFDYEDSDSSYTFWRNAFTVIQMQGQQKTEQQRKRDLYLDYYTKALDDMIDLAKDENQFYIEEFDISKQIEGYVINKQLNVVFKVQNIVFKQTSDFLIRDNDLVVIKEDGKVVLIGFVVSVSTEISYGEFPSRDASVGDIGYLYNIAHTVADRAVANYAVSGRDTKDLEENVFSDIYNNFNVFQIIKRILVNYMFAVESKSDVEINTVNYYFDAKAFNESFAKSTDKNPASFAIIFVFLRLMQKYGEYTGFGDFQWAKVEHGEHKAYNEMITSNFELFRPSFKTAASVFEDVIKQGMYNFFVDVDGKFVVRPPLYNYYGQLPEDNVKDSALILTNNENGEPIYVLNPAYSHYIKESEILSEKLTFDNADIKTRTDAQFVWPFVGQVDWKPTFYIDVKGLVKYGFRNGEPYTNPNATSSELATLLAAMNNVIENSMTRKLEIQVKTQDIDRFKIGEMYYIEKPIEGAVNSLGEKTGSFGYLIDVERSVEYGKYPLTKLTFSYLRTMEMVEPKAASNKSAGNIVDIINIYRRYGIFQNIATSRLTSAEYKKKSKQQIDAFYDKIKDKKLIPAFKVLPSILDFIKITYEDTQIAQKAKTRNTQIQIKEADSAQLDSDGTTYKSFKVKMQRFFDVKVNNGTIYEVNSNPKFSTFTNATEAFKQNIQYTKNLYKSFAGKTINHHGYPFKIYENDNVNLDIYNMDTGYDQMLIGFVKQLLLNRIVECDADMKTVFEAALRNYDGGITPNLVYMPNSALKKFAINTSFSWENDFVRITTTDVASLVNYRYSAGSAPNNQTRFIYNSNGSYIVHPQFFLTMDMLQLNIMLSKANTVSAESIDKKLNNTSQHLLESHQQGRAIDIHIPARGANPGKAQFLYPYREFMPLSDDNVVKTTITYKSAFYDWFEGILIKHFDVVKRYPMIQFDISPLNLKDSTGAPITIYYADVYHLEVLGDNYQQIAKELLKVGNASSGII